MQRLCLLGHARARRRKQRRDPDFDKIIAGDPAKEIIALATQWGGGFDCPWQPRHGRLAGLSLGSVAQKVLARAACPVLSSALRQTRPAALFEHKGGRA